MTIIWLLIAAFGLWFALAPETDHHRPSMAMRWCFLVDSAICFVLFIHDLIP